ncbi:MAG: caspase family protein [Bacteroidota bacterium]
MRNYQHLLYSLRFVSACLLITLLSGGPDILRSQSPSPHKQYLFYENESLETGWRSNSSPATGNQQSRSAFQTHVNRLGKFSGQEIYFDTSTHYEIETSYQLVSDRAQEVGLIFGQDFSQNHYYFSILPNGNWNISILRSSERINLSRGSRRHLQIFKENKLTVRKISHKWHFYINEELVQSIDACDIFGHWIGLHTPAYSQVAWKSLSVSRLKARRAAKQAEISYPPAPSQAPSFQQKAQEQAYNPFPEESEFKPYILNEPGDVPLPPNYRKSTPTPLYRPKPVPASPPPLPSYGPAQAHRPSPSYGSPPSYQKPLAQMGTGRNFLLLIAANDYLFWTDLNNAMKDAHDIGNVLINNYQFEAQRVFKLLGDQATRENILETLDVLQRNIQPEDNLLIYYAGHGFYDPDNKRGYWVPKDARIGKTTDYIRNATIMDYLMSIKSKNTLLISDACYAGSISSFTLPKNNDFHGGIWVLTSGDIEKVWDGKPGENSPFAKYLISTLRNNQKEYLTFSELSESVKTLVRRYTPQNPIDFTLPKNLKFEKDFLFQKKQTYGVGTYGRE